jgi:hypothetical protein
MPAGASVGRRGGDEGRLLLLLLVFYCVRQRTDSLRANCQNSLQTRARWHGAPIGYQSVTGVEETQRDGSAMLDTLLPCLGEPFDAYSVRLGAPFQTAAFAGAILRRYRWRDSVLSVLFSAGRSVALHCSYPETQRDRWALPSLLFDLQAADPWGTAVYCGATGALLASHACPEAAIVALDAKLVSSRPRIVRECLDLGDRSN